MPQNQSTTDTSPATPTPELTDEQIAAEFERTMRRTELANTLRFREELNDYMRKNPALTLQEALMACFRNAERELDTLNLEEPAGG